MDRGDKVSISKMFKIGTNDKSQSYKFSGHELSKVVNAQNKNRSKICPQKKIATNYNTKCQEVGTGGMSEKDVHP